MLNRLIQASIMQYVAANTTSQLDPGKPLDRDPNTEGLQEWVKFTIQEINELPSREAHSQATVSVMIEAYSRSQSNLYKALEIADHNKGLISRQLIPVRNYGESGEPQIGHIRFNEGRTTNTNRGVWEVQTTIITGQVTIY